MCGVSSGRGPAYPTAASVRSKRNQTALLLSLSTVSDARQLVGRRFLTPSCDQAALPESRRPVHEGLTLVVALPEARRGGAARCARSSGMPTSGPGAVVRWRSTNCASADGEIRRGPEAVTQHPSNMLWCCGVDGGVEEI